MIAIPESISYYWADPINMAAIEVLSKSSTVPADLTLDEAERFEFAGLAADRVRVEFARFLRQLWAATWGAAVREALPMARLDTYGAHQAFMSIDPCADPSMWAAWESNSTPGLFALPDGRKLFTQLSLDDKEVEISLQFYVAYADGTYSTNESLGLGPNWEIDEAQRSTTRPELFQFERGRQVDEAPIAAVAREAIRAARDAASAG